MRLISWNINSLRMRKPLLEELLAEYRPDVVCLQEIKCPDEAIVLEIAQELGYISIASCQKTYNGVAILSAIPIDVIATTLCGYDYPEARFLKAIAANTCIYNVYVPNGQALGSMAHYKQLEYMSCLIDDVRTELAQGSSVIIAGDFNIAPTNADISPLLHQGAVCDTMLRQKWFTLLKLGLTDRVTTATWWDYRFKGNVKGKIDNVLCNNNRHINVQVLHTWRFDKVKPSDHAPLLAE